MKVKNKDVLVCGMALFAIFFGAGNIIFPPYLGVLSGDRWLTATLGFILSDPFLPILGVIVTASLGGRGDDLGKRVGPTFSKIIGTLAILFIGPFFAVPRTGATTHEILVEPLFPNISIVITSIIFFGLTLLIVLNPSRVINIIGQVLTPILIILLAIIVGKAIISPPAPMAMTGTPDLFRMSYREGYQTMDALGAPVMTGIVLSDLIRRGYKTHKLQVEASIKIGIVAFILLAIVYIGLTYTGATVSAYYTAETGRVDILLGMVGQMLGRAGQLIIGVTVTLACLTTATGLISTCGDFFYNISDGKLPYKPIVIISTFVAFIFSLIGVDGIINIAAPVLSAIYPIIIALMFYSIFDKKIKYNLTYTGAVIGAMVISIPQALNIFSAMRGGSFLQGYADWTASLPLAGIGFEWLIPALILSLIFTIIAKSGGIGKTINDPISD